MKNLLVTGGYGFIGSHFVRYALSAFPRTNVVNVDLVTYCGNPKNLFDVKDHPHYKFYRQDIGNLKGMMSILKKENIDTIIHFAAESDNNKAVHTPTDFMKTNALGTAVLLEAARQQGVSRFHHISTCEVFGQLSLSGKRVFYEHSPYKPRTPYNASKASADHIVRSYFYTYKLPITLSHCANNYGSHQFPEKVIPVFTIKALQNQKLPVFRSSGNKREWIHVRDHCRALGVILKKGAIGESYNIGTGTEKTIMDIATGVLEILSRPSDMIEIVPDRPGHDSRYLLNSDKIRSLGWKPHVAWNDGLCETVRWYTDHRAWWRPLLKRSHAY